MRDGHGNEVTAERIDTGWVEGYRSCRPPNTGWTGGRPVECTSPDGFVSMRVMQYPWTEERLPDDIFKVRRVVDWTAGIVLRDFCRGGEFEEVEDDTEITYEFRDRTCDEEYAGGPWAWVDDQNGPSDARHRRQKRTTTVTFPPSWNRPDQVVVSFGPWTRFEDDCRYGTDRSDTREVGGCSGETQRREWIEITHPSPLPPVADYTSPGSDTGWIRSGTYDRCPPPPPDNRDDDDDSGGGGNQYCVSGCTDHPGLHDYSNVKPGTGTEEPGDNDPDGGGGGGGGSDCFLTTAVVERRGEADGGPTLTLLRSFRDGWLSPHPGGLELIAEYYRIAPRIVAAIPEHHPEWDRIADEVDRAARAIRDGRPGDALAVYVAMVRRLEAAWLAGPIPAAATGRTGNGLQCLPKSARLKGNISDGRRWARATGSPSGSNRNCGRR